jgi:hypothetical protein
MLWASALNYRDYFTYLFYCGSMIFHNFRLAYQSERCYFSEHRNIRARNYLETSCSSIACVLSNDTYRNESIYRVENSRLLVKANVVPSSAILVILMMEELGSSETFVFKRATRRNNTEDDILHSHRRENLRSYIEEN